MARYFLLLIFCFSILFCFACSDDNDTHERTTKNQDLSVWIVSTTQRVLRDTAPGSLTSAELYAARNEWENFQILLRSKSAITGITLIPSDLHGPNGSLIKADDAFLYRQHQFFIETPSWGVTEFTPGWYPDALIPFKNPMSGEDLIDPDFLLAVPFDLPADETHGFLVDIYIPTSALSGVYHGSYLITARGETLAKIPVTITVWDFSLPKQRTLFTDFGAPEHQMRHLAWMEGESHSEAYWTAISDQCNELVSRHGINAVLKAYAIYFEGGELDDDGSFVLPVSSRNVIQTFINHHQPNAVRLPFRGTPTIKEVVFGSAYYDENTFHESHFTVEGDTRLINYLRSWEKVLNELQLPHEILFYVYLCDEPNTASAYNFVRTLGQVIRQASLQYIKVLVVEQTTPDNPAWGDLYDVVDIWVPYFSSFDPFNAAQRQQLGEMIWTYTALTEWGGGLSWQTDLPLLNHRIPTWISWKYDIKGLLYWSMAFWWGLAYPDPWTQPQTYLNEWQGQEYTYNGDGVLVYPAEKVGYDGIVPSLRLKAIRDGIEDYEYLTLLDTLGLREQALLIINSIAPSFNEFEIEPDLYENARRELATLITGS